MKPPSIFHILKKIITLDFSKNDHLTKLISSGVIIKDINSIFIEDTVEILPGTTIYPSTYLLGNTKIGSNCIIGPNSTISDTKIGDNSEIVFSIIFGSNIGKYNQIGPFAYIREESITEDNVTVGNFVEVKASKIGKNSKSKHLAYIGDTEISKNVNVGAGFVSANFDGKDKHKSFVEENVSIGSNSTIISPIVISKNAVIGAGSVVTKDVASDSIVAGVPAKKIKKGKK